MPDVVVAAVITSGAALLSVYLKWWLKNRRGRPIQIERLKTGLIVMSFVIGIAAFLLSAITGLEQVTFGRVGAYAFSAGTMVLGLDMLFPPNEVDANYWLVLPALVIAAVLLMLGIFAPGEWYTDY